MNTTLLKSITSYDVLIIGGGLIGMLSARALHHAGFQVAIIDKNQLGKEASWAAGGILSPLYPWQQNEPISTLVKESQQLFPILVEELKKETGIDSELIRSGMIILDHNEKNLAINWSNQNNEKIELLTQQALLDLESNLAHEFEEAIYLPNVRQVRPPQLIKATKQSLKENNVDIFENLAVENLIIEKNRVQGAATIQGSLYADKVVLCSGAWTPTFLHPHVAESIDIRPVRGQMILYKSQEKFLSHVVLREGSYLIPRKDGHLLCGSTVEHVGFDKNITQDAKEELKLSAEEICPKLKKCTPIKQWAALRPGTRRKSPYICKHPELHGLYFNSGHYRYGILMSIASANILASIISDSFSPSQIAPYAY